MLTITKISITEHIDGRKVIKRVALWDTLFTFKHFLNVFNDRSREKQETLGLIYHCVLHPLYMSLNFSEF